MKYTESKIYKPEIYHAIMAERQKQLDKWGNQDHGSPMWLAILTEEVGEVAKEICEFEHCLVYNKPYINNKKKLKDELIQVAAVCIAWLESYSD